MELLYHLQENDRAHQGIEMTIAKNAYLGLLGIFLLLGCHSFVTPQVKTEVNSASLKTSIVVHKKKSDTLYVDLVFENVSEKPLHIYYINDPLFGRTQNRFYMIDKHGKRYFELEEPPPPHGYVVSENDFYLIAPQSKKRFSVKVVLPIKNPVSVEWVYSNRVTSLKGGARTLDDKTKALFGGIEIPYIWTGSIETEVEID